MNLLIKPGFVCFLPSVLLLACAGNDSKPSKVQIEGLHLKTGQIISCGPPDKEFGIVSFDITGSKKVKEDFNTAVALLHSFEYDEAEKVFAKIIDESPGFAMAYWGVAMCNFHPLWAPPTEAELQKGAQAISIAQRLPAKNSRESDYINAIGSFYKDWNKNDHRTRAVFFEKAMEELHVKYPDDKEAAIFYALALDASANPADKTYANQKKAGDILNALYAKDPLHPGIVHYIIHTYDYPELAQLALPAARKYAGIAPSSAHALHMPSHIFTRLGLWDDNIRSNLAAASSAKCYTEQAKGNGHWSEELHAIDYLVYSYLQKGDNASARKEVSYTDTMTNVWGVTNTLAYALAAIPSRYVLENKDWQQAAALRLQANFSWQSYPWQEAIVHFTRLLGAAHTGNKNEVNDELIKLRQLKGILDEQKDNYKAKQVAIQIRTGEAWQQFVQGNHTGALAGMMLAAAMEDSTGKHPVTPGEVLPARELLGDMLMQTKQFKEALAAYEAVLRKSPNRFNSIYGASIAAERSGNKEKAVFYSRQLLSIADPQSNRPEVFAAKSFLEKQIL